MKKYFNFVLILSLAFAFSVSAFPNTVKHVSAATTNCTGLPGGPTYDFATGTPCSVVVKPNGVVNTSSRADLTIFNTFGTLKKGARGEKVAILQDALKALGYNINADGVFGAQTQNALKAFQKKSRLTSDGVAGNATIGTLINSLNKLPVLLLKKIRGVKDGTGWLAGFPEYAKDIDFNKESEWGVAVEMSDKGGTKYVRDFGPDPKDPTGVKRLEIITYVTRP